MIRVLSILLATTLAIGDVPRVVRVVAESVDVLDEPDDSAFSTGRLPKGSMVKVVRDGPDDWLTIAPPSGAFSFVNESDLEDLGDGRAKVLARSAAVRPGREGAKVPGPPRISLRQGSEVKLLDRSPLFLRKGAEVQTWIAIAPPAGEVRFIHASAAVDAAKNKPPKPRRAEPEEPDRSEPDVARADPAREGLAVDPIDAEFLQVGPADSESGLSPEVSDALKSIGDAHRAELRKPMERWNLGPIEARYGKLLDQGVEAAERRVIELRLAQVHRQKTAADAAAKLAKLIARSRGRDAHVTDPNQGRPQAATRRDEEYDATGLLQTSSRLVDGRKVYVLIGSKGAAVAYVAIPPGLPFRSLLSHRVGIRGEGHYDEILRSRLILARDIELLREERDPKPTTPIQDKP